MTLLSREGVALRRTRLHITGLTGSGKTAAICTTAPKRLGIYSVPGEGGYDTIPVGDPGIDAFVWTEEFRLKQDSGAVLKEFESSVLKGILTGGYSTVAIEGLHHYVDLVVDDVSGGAWFRGDEFAPSLYGVAYGRVDGFIQRICASSIPVVIFSSWATSKGDRSTKPGEKSGDVPQHTYPDLVGKYGREVLGKMSITVHQSWRKEVASDPRSPKIPMWQLKPDGEVWGCSVKVPPEVSKRLPTFCKADYNELVRVIEQAEKEAEK